MVRRLIEAFRQVGGAARCTAAVPRCRPTVEALEGRLAPSVTPMLENPVASVMQAPLPPAIHATIQSPAPVAAIASAAPAPADTAPADTAPAAPLQASDRAEFFASTFAVQDTPRLNAMEFSSANAAPALPAAASVPSPAHAGQPLLVWVLGMTCMLMLSWERHLRKPSLARGTARWTRRMKSLSELSALFARVWRPRARSACV
jgi:hypothetical protein